jgi:hypothetical protein
MYQEASNPMMLAMIEPSSVDPKSTTKHPGTREAVEPSVRTVNELVKTIAMGRTIAPTPLYP